MTDRSVTLAERFLHRDRARQIYGPMADEYGRFQLVGDPPVDDLIDELGPNHEALLSRLLPALRSDIPPWVDWERMDHGARTYQRLGPAAMMILSAWSLMNGYRCGPAVKPLAWTGQLEKRAPRRLAETSRFVTEVCQEGGMRPGSRGFELSVRVRIMHALVRRMLRRSPDWDRAAWGEPINQGDMAGTVVEFSLLVLAGARKMGFHFTTDEADAVVHLWRYCGHVMGVDAALLRHFETERAGVRFAEMIDSVQPGPDGDSVALAQALRKVPRQMARTRTQRRLSGFVTRLHDGFTWAFNGDAIAGDLGIPNRRWRYAIYPARAVVAPLELTRRLVPGVNRVATRIGNRIVRADVDRMLAGAEPEFLPQRVPG